MSNFAKNRPLHLWNPYLTVDFHQTFGKCASCSNSTVHAECLKKFPNVKFSKKIVISACGILISQLISTKPAPNYLQRTPGDLQPTPGGLQRTSLHLQGTSGDLQWTPGNLLQTPGDLQRPPGDLQWNPGDLQRASSGPQGTSS